MKQEAEIMISRKSKISLSLTFLLLFIFVMPANGAIKKTILVSTDWVAAHLYQAGVIVVHIEELSDGTDHYGTGHIPQARFVATEDLGINRNGVEGMLPPLDTLIELVRDLGVDNETKKIVLYGATNPGGPARLYHVLDYLGLGNKTALMDGHFPRWMAEGRLTTTSVPDPTYSNFVPKVNPKVLTTRSTVGDLMSTIALRRTIDTELDTKGFALFDSRVDSQYAEGHIPGAIQGNPLLDFVGFTTDGGADPGTRWVLRERIEIFNRYNSLGLDRRELAITSCRTGIAGSLLYFILKYVGFEVTLYDGSFNEWSVIEIQNDHELDIWEAVYPGYTDNDIGKLPFVTGMDRWEPVF
jgi:thiosulfate/3-mercaptopyruvate sulfurtransferase